MPAPTLITELSQTAGSNGPVGGVDTPSVLDDYQRAHGAFIAQLRDGVGFSGQVPVANGGTGAATAAAARTALQTAISGANNDITSLSNPEIGSATATTQAVSDSTTKVATTQFVDRAVSDLAGGTGASGTWPISISGTAAQATVALNALGVGQSYTSYSGRSLDTYYQNTTGRPIFVTITLSGASSALCEIDAYVLSAGVISRATTSESNGATWNSVKATLSFVVAASDWYKVKTNAGSNAVQFWYELR